MSGDAQPGLYVHVPFCRSKCHYCSFYSVARTDLAARWTAALGLEAATREPEWDAFDTCYVGGGTPSLLSEDRVAAVVRIARDKLGLTPSAELTIEVNPADVTLARARHWYSLGFSRVSVGVQSFRDDELRWLGRRHDAKQALTAIEQLRRAGFASLGIDLMRGLPRQTPRQRRESLDCALACEPQHLSCYELTVESGTPLESELAAGRVELPTAERGAEAFVALSETLRGQGWLHYEVSNFARSAADRSRHNGKYWDHTPYLGLGPAAHSFAGRRRWSNQRSVERYVERLEAGRSAVRHREDLTREQLRWERVSLGLRTSRGVALDDLSVDDQSSTIAELEHLGLLRHDGERLVPTVKGYLVADALSRRLLFGCSSTAS